MAGRRSIETIARELALQYLYCREMHCGCDSGFEAFAASFPPARKAAERARRLIDGVSGSAAETDAVIASAADNWPLHRMSVVCRNVLRIGVFELMHRPEVPFKVVIDEAIELAKRYEAPEAGAFVNGLLDALAARFRAAEKAAVCQEDTECQKR